MSMSRSFLPVLLTVLLGVASLSATAAPAVDATESPSVSGTSVETAVTRIDLNTADAQTLQRELSGIGKSKSEAIVTYRETHGKFASVDELLEVKGIGKGMLERNRDKLMVE